MTIKDRLNRLSKESTIRIYGHSYEVVVPRRSPAAQKSYVIISRSTPVDEGCSVIPKEERWSRKKRYNLDELLNAITPENKHEEVSTGSPVGREVWNC